MRAASTHEPGASDGPKKPARANTRPEKTGAAGGADVVVTVVNLDRYNVEACSVQLDPEAIGVEASHPFQMHDLLSNQRFLWQGQQHFIRLDPRSVPAHIFVVRRRMRDERDFDYFV